MSPLATFTPSTISGNAALLLTEAGFTEGPDRVWRGHDGAMTVWSDDGTYRVTALGPAPPRLILWEATATNAPDVVLADLIRTHRVLCRHCGMGGREVRPGVFYGDRDVEPCPGAQASGTDFHDWTPSPC
jgi:hypothetical protein